MRRISLFALLFAVHLGAAGEARMHLASQYRWERKDGFYLSFENSAKEKIPPLSSLRLITGIGDGQSWQFISRAAPWELGHEYLVEVSIGAQATETKIDGQLLGRLERRCVPVAAPVELNTVPSWAAGLTDYFVVPVSTTLKADGGASLEHQWPQPAADELPLWLFNPEHGLRAPFAWTAGQTVTITAKFRLDKRPTLKECAPLIDRWGQAKVAKYPGKITADDDLKQAEADEEQRLTAWGEAPAGDAYGGSRDAGWKDQATGFYRLHKRDGVWWLITPTGLPCIYLGMCGAPTPLWDVTPVNQREYLFEWLPPTTGPLSGAWVRNSWGEQGTLAVAFHAVNMMRRDGDAWQTKLPARVARRLRCWGFSGIAKWGGQDGLPSTPVIHRWGLPNLIHRPDFFDPAQRERFAADIRQQVAPRQADPMIVGWSFGNEIDEIIQNDELLAILAKGATVASKQALVDYAVKSLTKGDAAALAQRWGVTGGRPELLAAALKPPADDLEALRRFYASAYYEFVATTVKQADPNHLFMGWWIVPGWWQNEEDWRLQAKWCDVIGYDFYHPDFVDERLDRLMKETDKPVFCGEFSFPPTYAGRRGFGTYGVFATDDADAGEQYRHYVQGAARNPYCVGLGWFQYRDEPLTGRGPGRGDQLVLGEDYAFGVVDVGDRPKWDLVSRMRDTNRAAVKWRMGQP